MLNAEDTQIALNNIQSLYKPDYWDVNRDLILSSEAVLLSCRSDFEHDIELMEGDYPDLTNEYQITIEYIDQILSTKE